MNFSGKTVIVTGAAQGIGREYALSFAKAGAFVAVADINIEKSQNVLAEIKEAGGDGIAIQVDISNEESVKKMVDDVVAAGGTIDVLINNASIFATIEMKPFDQITVQEWDKLMAVNLKGTWLASKEVAKVMKEKKKGKIIHIGSCAMVVGKPLYLHYVSSKSAIIGMTRAMATELGEWEINVNAILPGPTYTEVERGTNSPEQIAAMLRSMCIHRKQEPKDLVGPMMFFASEYSDFVTGQCLLVDGGLAFY